jgi:hypothetical protein
MYKVDWLMVAGGEGWNRFLGKSAKPNPILARGIAHLLTNPQTHLYMKNRCIASCLSAPFSQTKLSNFIMIEIHYVI